MPELPEVETVVRTLRPALLGRRITAVKSSRHKLRRPWKPAWKKLLLGQRIVALRRPGKWIILELNQGHAAVIHLGMTGQLRVSPRREPRQDHTHWVFRLAPKDMELRFRDVRRFGSIDVLPQSELESFFADRGLGPEPFELTKQDLVEQLRRTQRCLKAVLLDQHVVAGVGNIYADEALFKARLHPALIGAEVADAAAERLRRSVVKVLNRAIHKNGSSIRDYLDGDGNAGSYQREFRVYQQTGKPCHRCRTPIKQIRLAGRSTHYCPQCQEL